ncbi:MAG: 50S ribosomal protein L11 methyltransferase [Burkholderiales bacterium]|nr:50S ribosomal protein L11 methyltransferase [Burkholderiales bacterium]
MTTRLLAPGRNVVTTWIEISGPVKGEAADAIADALLDAGALAVDVADLHAESDAEQPIFGEPGMALSQRWADSRIAALFEGDIAPDDIAAIWTALQAQSAEALGPHEFRVVPETDWVRATQAQFEPIEITPSLWIVPTWCEPPNPDAINLRVDPGMAFGTGTHPTTRLCLAWLCELPLPGKRVLDYGCGSGILAMAAAALGAMDVVGVDIDPYAVETARQNAAMNRLTARFDVSDAALEDAFDVVVANILAGPLTVLAPAICAHVKPGGVLALAGILSPQIERIREAYAPWIALSVSAEREGWVRMTGTRHVAVPMPVNTLR